MKGVREYDTENYQEEYANREGRMWGENARGADTEKTLYEEPRDHLLRREKMLEAIEGFLQDGVEHLVLVHSHSLTASLSYTYTETGEFEKVAYTYWVKLDSFATFSY